MKNILILVNINFLSIDFEYWKQCRMVLYVSNFTFPDEEVLFTKLTFNMNHVHPAIHEM